MLDNDYSARFETIVSRLDYEIELPAQWQDFFEQRGEVPSYQDDQRDAQRLKVRTHGLMYCETYPRFCSRPSTAIGIYTRDFSRHGVGILTPMQLMPEETFRLVLPTFWLQVRAVRVRRLTSKCFEVGCQLIHRHDADMEAFGGNDQVQTAAVAAADL